MRATSRSEQPALQRLGLRWLAAVASLPLVLSGCSGTRFGEALSRSFPDPTPAQPPAALASTAESSTLAGVKTPASSPAPGSTNLGGPVGASGAIQPPAAVPATAASSPSKANAPSTTSTATSTSKSGASSPSERMSKPLPSAPRTTAAAPAAAAPYRVTIRLPEADPSAPAEVVTEALRSAGVPFEVETIERMGSGSVPGPAATPAPASGSTTVRPAPPAR